MTLRGARLLEVGSAEANAAAYLEPIVGASYPFAAESSSGASNAAVRDSTSRQQRLSGAVQRNS